MKRVVVVGGGIAGLATALHLKDRARAAEMALDVVVLESGDCVGGNIRTDREAGWILERGPNGFLDNAPATLELVRRVGLADQIQKADDSAAKRYLYRNGRLHLLPAGPIRFLLSDLLSLPGRLRVMLEPFARRRPEGVDETIYQFAARRIGDEAASVLVDAIVSGVFAGNIHELSLASTFPTMARMEREHGGLVKAMVAKQRACRAARKRAAAHGRRGESAAELIRPGGPAGPPGTLTSFDDGLDRLPDSLKRELGASVRVNAPVVGLELKASPVEGSYAGPSRWEVRLDSAETLIADATVLAVPAAAAASLLEHVDEDLADQVAGIRSASVAVVALGYDAGLIGGPPDGFGFLVPHGEGPRILGCLWDSSLFPGRAPPNGVLLRAMIGGAHDPDSVELDDSQLVNIVRRDLQTTMGIAADPVLVRIYRHEPGIAQYDVGHEERLAAINRRLQRYPGLSITGSSYYGVSMNACIEHAAKHAETIVAWLAKELVESEASSTGTARASVSAR